VAASRLRSPLGRAIGLGSAKEGVRHWWDQRVTALVLVPLVLWLVAAVIHLAGGDRDSIVGWAHHPVNAVLMIVLLGATFYHGALGLQVVVEDYVEHEASRLTLVILMWLAAILLAALGTFSVLKLALVD